MPLIALILSLIILIGISTLVNAYLSLPLLLAYNNIGIISRIRSIIKRVIKREREEGSIP